METVLDATPEESSTSGEMMSVEELKAWIQSEGVEELDLFARNCWGDHID